MTTTFTKYHSVQKTEHITRILTRSQKMENASDQILSESVAREVPYPKAVFHPVTNECDR